VSTPPHNMMQDASLRSCRICSMHGLFPNSGWLYLSA